MDKDHDPSGSGWTPEKRNSLLTSRARAQRRWNRALRRMTPLQRTILYDLAVNDMSYPQIAERYAISLGEVETHFSTALRILATTFHPPASWWLRAWFWLRNQ